jgi:cell wall-associated NlpC family hydrolase
MAKLRRGGFIFLSWKGDHGPRHVHVYRGGQLVVKWDLDNERAMEGKPTRRLLDLIRELKTEGLL